jgi:WD40 repeat protein
MGIVGTLCGSLWYICWTTERSKTRLVASHTDLITGIIPIEDTHIVTSSLDGTIRIFQLEDRNEILRFDANGLVSQFLIENFLYFKSLESNLFNIMG